MSEQISEAFWFLSHNLYSILNQLTWWCWLVVTLVILTKWIKFTHKNQISAVSPHINCVSFLYCIATKIKAAILFLLDVFVILYLWVKTSWKWWIHCFSNQKRERKILYKVIQSLYPSFELHLFSYLKKHAFLAHFFFQMCRSKVFISFFFSIRKKFIFPSSSNVFSRFGFELIKKGTKIWNKSKRYKKSCSML